MSEKEILRNLKETGIIEAIGDPISIQDTELKVLYQNKSHRNAVGDHIGEYCYKAYQGKEQPCKTCHLVKAYKDGLTHTLEQSMVKDNKVLYAEITASPLKNANGKIVAGIEVIRDITKRKLAEEALKNARNELEKRVKERTVELEEINAALRVLLKQRENDQKEFESNILSNLKYLIHPYIRKLKRNRALSEDIIYLNLLESNLNEIVSPFASKLSFRYLDFTPKEMLVADLIKDGKQDKDIAEVLNITLDTVKTHRQNIRKKLGIYGKRINLRTTLVSLAE